MRRVLSGLVLATLFLAQAANARGGPLTVNFDSLKQRDPGSTLAAYLEQYGITASGVTPGTNVTIYDDRLIYGGKAFRASSPHNVLTQEGSNDPVSYTLNFAVPQDHVSFTRPYLIAATSSGITHPAWQAYAFDGMGHQTGSVSEGLIGSFSDVPAATFTLQGPDITSLRIDSQNHHFAAFSALLLDDLVLPNGAPVPEPTTLVLFGAGLLGICGYLWERTKGKRPVTNPTTRVSG